MDYDKALLEYANLFLKDLDAYIDTKFKRPKGIYKPRKLREKGLM